MNKAQQVLTEARGLIQKGWTQGFYARGADGGSVAILSTHATCFCALGALNRVECSKAERADALDLLEDAVPGYRTVHGYNDLPGTTKEDILALYDRAIAAAGEV